METNGTLWTNLQLNAEQLWALTAVMISGYLSGAPGNW